MNQLETMIREEQKIILTINTKITRVNEKLNHYTQLCEELESDKKKLLSLKKDHNDKLESLLKKQGDHPE